MNPSTPAFVYMTLNEGRNNQKSCKALLPEQSESQSLKATPVSICLRQNETLPPIVLHFGDPDSHFTTLCNTLNIQSTNPLEELDQGLIIQNDYLDPDKDQN